MPILIFILSLVVSSFCFAQAEEDAGQEMDGFSLVQYESDGTKKWELNGSSADVEEENVKIDDVSALAFGEKTTIKLKARQGNFDREKEMVHLENNVVVKAIDGTGLSTDSLDWDAKTENVSTDAQVTIKRHGFEVEGKGAVCNLQNKTAEVKKDVTVNITSPDTGIIQNTDDKIQNTEITCDGPLELNYKKNRATFRNNVKVVDREGTIFADRVDVLFNPGTRKVKCVACKGNVRIINGENVTYSDKAIYLVDQGRVILPKRPKLVIKNENKKQ